MAQLLSHLSVALAPYLGRRRWHVAYSGGLDSRVLLHLVWLMRQRAFAAGESFPEVCAVHVNHQLQSGADAWAGQCQAICSQYNIPFECHRVTIQGSRQGIESLARTARYEVFEAVVEHDDAMLLAHHQDDQAETFLLRLMRGAGLAGLAAMPAARNLGRGELFRPMLNLSRAELEAYAEEHRLEWIEDPSNGNTQYRRNFLRHHVMPVLAEKWPNYRNSIAAAAELQAEASELLGSYLSADVKNITTDGALDLNALRGIEPIRQRALLRHYIFTQFGQRIDRAQSYELAEQFLASSGDSQPVFSLAGGITLRAFKGRLYWDESPANKTFDSGLVLNWDTGHACHIEGLGQLSAQAGGRFAPKGELTVRFRRGGERCRLAGHGHSKSLKKLLQEWGIPPWQRDRLPLIYCGDEIAAIADMAICEGYQLPDGEAGIQLQWVWSR